MTRTPLRYSKKTLRPFQEENLTPLTLRDELQDRYLPGMISWLVNRGWPAARAAGSLWQMSELGTVLIEWLELPGQSQGHPDLAKQAADTLRSGIVPYLLDHATQTPEGYVTWDVHLHDTSQAVAVLLKFLKSFRRELPIEQQQAAISVCLHALTWIIEERLISSDLSNHTSATLAKVAEALGSVIRLYGGKQNPFVRRLRRKQQWPEFIRLRSERHLAKLVEEMLRRTHWSKQTSRGTEPGDVLDHLGSICPLLDSKGLRHRLSTSILASIEVLEDELLVGEQKVGAARALALNEYVRACMALASVMSRPPRINEWVTLPLLYKFCWEIDVFPDGSIYHELRVTTEFANCLNGLLAGRWAKLDDPIITIYRTSLQQSVPAGRMSELRAEIFGGLHREEELSQRLQNALQNQAWQIISLAVFLAALLALLGGVLFASIWDLTTEAFLTALTFWIGLLGTGVTAYARWTLNRVRRQGK